MTICLYSGTPGSGKSCHQAELVYYSLKQGYDVVANYYFNVKRCGAIKGSFTELNNETLTPECLINHSRMYFKNHRFKEGRILLLIDEAQLLFNSREWGRQDRQAWLAFFTQHRKYGYDVFLIAQFDRMLDRQIRSLIEYNIIHRKFSNGSWKVKLLGLLFGGNAYIAVCVWYPMKMTVGSNVHHIRKKWYSLYDSYKDFSSDSISDGRIAGGADELLLKAPELGRNASEPMGGTTTPPIEVPCSQAENGTKCTQGKVEYVTENN